MSERTIIQWRLDSEDRNNRNAYIGPAGFYFWVKQTKRDQVPTGFPSIEFVQCGVEYLRPECDPELIRALQDALAVAREWSKPAAPPAEVNHE